MRPSSTFTRPREGARVQTDGAVLQISTTAADEVDSLGSELGHRGLTTHLELSLLDVDHHLSSGQATLMTRITANTYQTISTNVPVSIQRRTYPLFTNSNYKR